MSGACGSPGEPWEGQMDMPTAQKTLGKERRSEQFLATRSENAGIGLALLVFN